MNVAMRATARNTQEFVRWAGRAEFGQSVTYHIGNLARDRAESPVLHALAEAVMIFRERKVIVTSRQIMHLPLGTSTWYVATRSGHGRAPRALLLDQCDPHEFRALEAIHRRDPAQSASRAIRDHLGCPESLAIDLLSRLCARGWVEPAKPRGWRMTPSGQQVLA
jgi:hypothetical protein